MVGPEQEDLELLGRKRNKSGEEAAAGHKRARMEEGELTRRIKKYLEENRSQKFIDIEKMALTLHASYPDYGRKKQAVFKAQVDRTFKELKDSLGTRRKRSQGQQRRRGGGQADQQEEPEEQEPEEPTEPETAVRGPSMNSRLSALYTGPVAGDTKDDEEDCEVIEVDDDGEETEEGKETAVPAAADEPVTEYERIRARARAAAAQLKEPRKTKPKESKSLSPAPSIAGPPPSAETPEEDVDQEDEICEVIRDDNEKDSTPPFTGREASKSSTSCSPVVTPGQSSRQGLLARALGRRIEQEEAQGEAARARKRPLETPSSKKKLRKTETAVEMSTVTFADFGGNDQVVGQVCRLLVHLRHPEVYDRLGVSPPRGFLLHGPPGCGKTLLAHAIAGELKLPFIKVAAPELVSGVSGDSEGRIRELFDQAAAAAPCVLFIDEIDSITGRRETAAKQMEGRMVAQLVASMDGLGPGVVVVGATGRLEALDPALRRAGRFDREIGLGIPDRAARERILEVVCRGLRLAPGTCLATLATLSPGYVGADLTSLAREAAMAAVNRVLGGRLGGAATTAGLLTWLRGEGRPLDPAELEGLHIGQADWQEALRTVQPSAKREGFATVPGVTWADVGALEAVREELQLSILAPVHHGAQFEGLGLPSSSGVLLVGPPGCGKTLVAKAIANEAGINFISVKGPELINMYVGESERAVRGVFQRAKNSAPCVIFFDEVDSLCPRRSSGSSDGGSSSRVVNQLLTELDGVEGRAGVWVLAATNRPDILDPALLRPGRLDKTLYVDFPTARDKVAILAALTRDGSKPALGPGVSLEALGMDPRCEGFSGADMGHLVREASMAALREAIRTKNVSVRIEVLPRHFERAFSSVRPSVGEKDRRGYLVMKKKYGRKSEEEEMSVTADAAVDTSETADDSEENMEDAADLEEGNVSRLPGQAAAETAGAAFRTFECHHCDQTFNNRTAVRRHLKRSSCSRAAGTSEHGMEVGGSDHIDDDDSSVTETESQAAGTEGAEEVLVEEQEQLENVDHLLETSGSKSSVSSEDLLEGTEDQVEETEEQVEGAEEQVEGTEQQVESFYASLSTPSGPPALRFLPGMVVRVSDSCSVAAAAGRPARVLSLRPGTDLAAVLAEGSAAPRLVRVGELLPGLPEEGDRVASLAGGDGQEVGELLSVDEEDQAVVQFPGRRAALPLDRLCRVATG